MRFEFRSVNAALKQTALSLFAKCNRGATVTEEKATEEKFSYQALLRILILCLCNKQLIFFRNMLLKGPFGFFLNAESLPERYQIRAVYACAGGLTF